jgi:tetratricopeptide (TPR) repeat protein
MSEYRAAIRLKPDHAEAHGNLGSALKGQGKLDEAIAGYREAIRLKPDYAEAHSNLGGILKSRGDDAGALAMYRKWREINNKHDTGLPASAEIRSQTLDWLKAERDAWSKLIDGGDAGARAQAVQNLKQKKVETNLATVRDPEALARLPEPERKEWQSLWSDVDSLLERAQGHPEKAVAAASPMPAKAPEPDPNPTAAAVNPRYAPQDLAQSYINQGLTSKAVPLLLTASAADPSDTFLSLKVAALQAWFGQEKELAATRQRILAYAKGTNIRWTAERAAKACSIRPSTDKAELEAVLALGRAGAKDLEGEAQGPWCLLALGMAEYRSGNDAAADEVLLAAAEANPNEPFLTGTSAFYRAMSLFRQGKSEEARKLAIEFAARMNPLPADEKNPLTGGAKFDHLILWLAYKEAKASIKFEAAPAVPVAPKRK